MKGHRPSYCKPKDGKEEKYLIEIGHVWGLTERADVVVVFRLELVGCRVAKCWQYVDIGQAEKPGYDWV